ncbi:2023_t:CDS:2 [Entrophospora sp. SA101]|nr:2023_t:CDS:2 [Entrophospora sp. SA101]
MTSLKDYLTNLLITNAKIQFALTALSASILTGLSIFSYQSYQRDQKTKALKREFKSLPPSTALINHRIRDINELLKDDSEPEKYEEKIIREQLTRNISFLGEEGVEKLRKSFVIIIGAGGVGSWAVLMLIRSGVEHIRIIDFDQVTVSSLNRHAVATHADVGFSKVIALKKHLKQIAPWAKVEAVTEIFNSKSAPKLLSGNADFIVDAIDNIDTKLALLKYCHDNELPIISSMGAGAKADPSRIQMSDIKDPLARTVRRRLKKMGVKSGITVVYSTEKPNIKLLPLDESRKDNPQDFATLPDFRCRILPVLGTIPAMFGMSIATYIITKIAGYHIEPLLNKNRESLYARLHRDLLNRETRIYGIGYIYDEIWRSKSAISGSCEKPTLIRWNKDEPLTTQNCVVMTKTEVKEHEKLQVKPEEHYPSEIVDLVHARFKEEKEISRFR